MKACALATVILIALPGCAGPATDPGADKDRRECMAAMYAGRRGHSSPDWNVFDYCMKQRGYRPSNRPA